MKIAFFWFLENHYSKDWIGPHDWFYKVFDELLIFVGDVLIKEKLNHYFLPGVNILSTVIPDKNRKTLVEAGKWLKLKVRKIKHMLQPQPQSQVAEQLQTEPLSPPDLV